jgi:acetoin utilization deacetylase AcuC-like enzyme
MTRVLIGALGALDEHDTGGRHFERPQRLPAALRGVADVGLGDSLRWLDGRDATRAELTRVHDETYLDALAAYAAKGGGEIDPDTTVSVGSWTTAVRAAGMGLDAIEALQRGEGDAAFIAIRPPGHHAKPAQAMGFCILNNVAISAAALADAGERVLVVDWDVHHGNGTQAIFWDDPRVLFFSTHQWPSYPGTGPAHETGGPAAPGLNINVPLPAGATGDAALAAIDDLLAPTVDAFRPTWVLVSAGYDAHRDDPLADLAWSAGDFADLTARVMEFAPQTGRLVAFLEGGYDLSALRRSVGATVAGLAGGSWRPEAATAGGPGRDAVARALEVRRRTVA